jgi:hypothetical protein
MSGLVQGGGAVTAISLAVLFVGRFLLLAVVVLWSLKADEKGRRHALALLRLLKFQLPSRKRPQQGAWSERGAAP